MLRRWTVSRSQVILLFRKRKLQDRHWSQLICVNNEENKGSNQYTTSFTAISTAFSVTELYRHLRELPLKSLSLCNKQTKMYMCAILLHNLAKRSTSRNQNIYENLFLQSVPVY